MIGRRHLMYVASTLALTLNGGVLLALWAKVDNGLMIGLAHAGVSVLALWGAWAVVTLMSTRGRALMHPSIAHLLAVVGGTMTLLAISALGITFSAYVTVPSHVAAAPNKWLLADRERETVSLVAFGSMSILFLVWLLESRRQARLPWFGAAGLAFGVGLAQLLFWSRALHWIGR